MAWQLAIDVLGRQIGLLNVQVFQNTIRIFAYAVCKRTQIYARRMHSTGELSANARVWTSLYNGDTLYELEYFKWS